jgi:hypothetical protein
MLVDILGHVREKTGTLFDEHDMKRTEMVYMRLR